MGIGGISIWQLLIIALIIVLLFGTKKLRSLGSDLGGALKGFKSAIKEDEKDEDDPDKLTADGDDASTDAKAASSAKSEQAKDK